MILSLTLLCVMGRIIIVDINLNNINPDNINPDNINPNNIKHLDIKHEIKENKNDVSGNIYEKMLKISINNINNLKNKNPIKREALWFDSF